jgi:transposase
MRTNISFNGGSLILIDKVDRAFNLFDSVFKGITGKTKHLIESAKAFINNRLDKCVSVNQITDVYPEELFESLGFKEKPKQRTLYRDLERIGIRDKLIIEKYQQILKRNNLVSDIQFPDFSSSYFEGDKAELGELGYSRDGKSGKKQITFGIQVGENTIPTALTIQKGNVCDKKHFKFMLKLSEKILDKNSLLVYDCGGNSKESKKKIRDLEFNYLTLRPRHRDTYRKYIRKYKESNKETFFVNGAKYKCVKIVEGDEVKYIFHSKNLYKKLKKNRNKKFRKELKNNKKLLEKIKKGKELKRLISEEGYLVMKGAIQKTLDNIDNPFITGLDLS